MKLELLSIILSNALLMLSAVWRISGKLTTMTEEIKHTNEKLDIHKNGIDLRLASLEERVKDLEKDRWRKD
jgi:hypothetical protein